MNLKLSAVLAATILIGATNTRAAVVFSDNFNTENGGVGTLNYNSFANFNVNPGTVDLIGNGFFDFYPGNGLYVDLDGSSGNAGVMTSDAIAVVPGNYVLSFQLGGSTRGDQNTVEVAVDTGFASNSYTLNSADPLTTYFLPFVVGAPANINLVFHNLGGDNLGVILDNVVLESREANPTPDAGSTAALLGLTAAAVGFIRRKL